MITNKSKQSNVSHINTSEATKQSVSQLPETNESGGAVKKRDFWGSFKKKVSEEGKSKDNSDVRRALECELS